MSEVRLIDANAYIDEINERIDAAIKWGCNAIADGDKEIKLRAEQAVATFCEASLTAKKMPTIDPVKWIPVSERLPEPNSAYEAEPVYYLVQNEYDDAMVATFVKFPGGARIWQQMYQDGAIMDDIVAWMPLPEPWKGEEDE